MESCVTFTGTEKELETFRPLVIDAKDYALSHGLISRSKENPASAESVTYVPFLLVPSPFPQKDFEEAREIQKQFNLLMHRIAHDYDFLLECLKSTIAADKDYTGELWKIYETVITEGIKQPVSLGMNRSDYMLHKIKREGQPDEIQLKQIEFNTMASSFGGLCQRLYDVHKYVLENINDYIPEKINHEEKMAKIPTNNAGDGLAEALVLAWEKYGNENAVIAFLVYEIERNRYDQKWIEYTITGIGKKMKKKIKVIRVSLEEIQEKLVARKKKDVPMEEDQAEAEDSKDANPFAAEQVLTDDKKLMINGNEVAVVYQRSCYTPRDFKCPEDWEARLAIERSQAIKCPSVGYHLAGTKKVQQSLAKPRVVERFLKDQKDKTIAERIRKTFAGQYTLDKGDEGDKNVKMALESPTKYVLKPQREGGGNNIFKEEDIKKTLDNADEREAYILMEKIDSPSVKSYVVRSGVELKCAEMVSELGIFGTFVGTKTETYLNEQCGHILRTKAAGTDEGGVATGYAAIDSPYLI